LLALETGLSRREVGALVREALLGPGEVLALLLSLETALSLHSLLLES